MKRKVVSILIMFMIITNVVAFPEMCSGLENNVTVNDGKYIIVSAVDGFYLASSVTEKVNGKNVYIDTLNNPDFTAWTFTYNASKNAYEIVLSNGMLLDACDDGEQPPFIVRQWEKINDARQQWVLQNAGDDCFYISNLNGYYLENANGFVPKESNVQVNSFNGSTAQKWKLEKVSSIYTINYDANGGMYAPITQSKPEGQFFRLSWGTPVRGSYTFKGWSLVRDEPPQYKAGDPFYIDADTTLYACWAIRYGSVNSENKITAFDALLALQKSIGKTDLSPDRLIAADVDGDGEITSFDSLLILQYSIEKINKFPVEE